MFEVKKIENIKPNNLNPQQHHVGINPNSNLIQNTSHAKQSVY